MKRPIAIFDIDGTIFRKNLQFELLEGLSYEGIFPREVRNKIVEYYRAWLENRGSYEKYRINLVRLYRQCLKGCFPRDVVRIAKKVAAFHHGRLFLYTAKLFHKLQKTHFTVAISGSPQEIVKEFNEYLKFNEAYGTVFEIDKDGFYTGRESYSPVKNKAALVKKIIAERKCSQIGSYGVGDTDSDISFLKIVDNPIAFNPDNTLKERAEKEDWRIVVERKDVVYTIQNSKSKF
ncbi:MAG: HAD-IB family phosphatase [Candidatus Moranbacteria bacterium]|nr:HAD-IB family phosphatase [Candidatus Moranbacteria bacterium]